MAITKTFQAHTELKASDLNELKDQANAYVHEVDVKKPDTIDISQYLSENDELPLGCYYVYYGNPTHTLAGRYTYTDTYFIAVCISHWEQAHTLAVYVKNSSNKYIYYETFRTDQASTAFEQYIAGLFASPPVTYDHDGLMLAADKQTFDEMVTEVFPLTVSVASSNAGTREVGSSVVPSIVLSITRRGSDVAASAEVTVSPNDGSLSQDKKTYTGAQIASGTKTYQISVAQGGQTKSIPNQTFSFMNYVYGGELNAAPADAAAVKAQLESWGSSHGVLSNKTNSTAITSSGAIVLPATKYYLFAVKGNVTLVVRDAATDGLITGATTGNGLSVARVNGSGNDNYSWVIVPASSNSWNFKITNS